MEIAVESRLNIHNVYHKYGMPTNPYIFDNAYIPPSYDNPLGKGDRTSLITIYQSDPHPIVGGLETGMQLIDGQYVQALYFTNALNVNNLYITFYFNGKSVCINEIAICLDNPISRSYWVWQGSNDNISFQNIGNAFAFEISTSPYKIIVDSVQYNTDLFKYYRMQGVSGVTDQNPYVLEFEFKISG